MTIRQPRSLTAAVAAVLIACTGTPHVDGAAGTSVAPNTPWTPPARHDSAAPHRAPPPVTLPPDMAARVDSLTLGDVVDLALRNNPSTRIAWENARAAAAAYGSAEGQYFPTIDLGLSSTTQQGLNSSGGLGAKSTISGPTASLTWLIFDIGGRSGSIDFAKNSLIAADWTHNGTIQNVVLQVQTAYFNYVASRALRAAQLLTLQEAQTNYQATTERRRQGLATIADELQAKTQQSQAQLALETTEGGILTTRGSLANAMGLPANLPYDIAGIPPLQIGVVTDSVDTLIERAVNARPDLAAARAQAAAAAANVSIARRARLPSFEINGSAGHSYYNALVSGNNVYTMNFGVKIPLFSGFSRVYDQQQAEAQARSANAQVENIRQQVILEVFSSYYAMQTAARRVATADDLLASASQSAEVALGRYKAGVGSIIDLLTAQSALADARAQAIETRWIWRTALAQLAHDIGILDVRGENPLRIAVDSSAIRK
jgi:outer membrane protein TolC